MLILLCARPSCWCFSTPVSLCTYWCRWLIRLLVLLIPRSRRSWRKKMR